MSIRALQNSRGKAIGLCLIPVFLCVTAQTFVQVFVISPFFLTKSPDDITKQLAEVATRVGLGAVVAAPLFVIGFAWVFTIMANIAQAWSAGVDVDVADLSNRVRASTPKVAIACIRNFFISNIGLFLGLIFLGLSATPVNRDGDVLPVLAILSFFVGFLWCAWAGINHSLSPAIVAIEGLSPSEASKRSKELLKGRNRADNPTSVISNGFIVLMFCNWAIMTAIGAAFEYLDVDGWIRHFMVGSFYNQIVEIAVRSAPTFIVFVFLMPFWCLLVSIVYYNCRVKFEGYDIDLLAKEALQSGKAATFRRM